MTIFVERRFELSDTQLIARFGAPTEAVGGEFQCHYERNWQISTTAATPVVRMASRRSCSR